MLIALEARGISKEKALAKGADIAVELGVREGLVYPDTKEQYFDLVKAHKNNKRGTSHTILARSHYELLDLEPERLKRQAEHFFQRKGGSVWGTTPLFSSESFDSFGGDLDNLDYLELQVKNDEARELYMRGVAPTQYYGRTQTDPHTFIVGIAPKAPLTQNRYVGFIYEGMPEDWWNGVGFLPKPTVSSLPKFQKFLEWMDINTITVGEDSHLALESIGFGHGAAPTPQDVLKKKMTAKNYAILLRETARTQENKLNDW